MISCRLIAVMAALTLPGMAQETRVRELIGKLEDERTWVRAVDELSRAGPVAVPLLKDVLSRTGEDALSEKEAVLSILGRMGPDAAGEIGFLITYGKGCEPELIQPLAMAVADLAPYGTVPTEELVRELIDWYRKQRITREVLTGLQLAQATIVARMQVDPKGSSEDLIAILASNSMFEREVAAEELGRRRERAAIPLLSRGVADGVSGGDRGIIFRRGVAISVDHFTVRAVRALLLIDPDDPRAAVAHGYQLARHPDPQTRLEAAMALGRCGPAAAPALVDLLDALSDPDVRVIREAVTALGMIGPKAGEAILSLEELTEHEDKQIVERAKAALRQIKGERQTP